MLYKQVDEKKKQRLQEIMTALPQWVVSPEAVSAAEAVAEKWVTDPIQKINRLLWEADISVRSINTLANMEEETERLIELALRRFDLKYGALIDSLKRWISYNDEARRKAAALLSKDRAYLSRGNRWLDEVERYGLSVRAEIYPQFRGGVGKIRQRVMKRLVAVGVGLV